MSSGTTYMAVVLFDVAAKICAVAPTVGSHSARGTRALASSVRTRAREAWIAGWCACAYARASAKVIGRATGTSAETDRASSSLPGSAAIAEHTVRVEARNGANHNVASEPFRPGMPSLPNPASRRNEQ